MTVALFVLMLSIPVLILARKNMGIVVLAALWGFALGMTAAGPSIAELLNRTGTSIAGLLG
ncbi:MAG: hypothetical protein J2P23_08670 [Microlunatus sp.]|nr:hypothetical protein [Microlunatus sp.]